MPPRHLGPPGSLQESPKTCEACGCSFPCGGERCWCAAVVVDPATLAELRRLHSDCLCERCLRAAASRPGPSGQLSQ